MYFIDISESNLGMLKERFGIDVQMVKMHTVIIDLFEKCLKGPLQYEEHPVLFYTRVNPTDGKFTIVEKTHYNNDVIHFTLPMQKGDDKDVIETKARAVAEASAAIAQQAGPVSLDNIPVEPSLLNQLQNTMPVVKEKLRKDGHPPILTVMPQLRPLLARYARVFSPGLHVLSQNEIPERVGVNILGTLG